MLTIPLTAILIVAFLVFQLSRPHPDCGCPRCVRTYNARQRKICLFLAMWLALSVAFFFYTSR